MVSQIIVSVVAAVCVALITGAYFGSNAEVAGNSRAGTEASPAAATATAGVALPPLEVQVIRDVPAAVSPGQELFPGVPVGVRPEALQKAVGEERKEPRRFLGIPIPFTSRTVDLGAETRSGG